MEQREDKPNPNPRASCTLAAHLYLHDACLFRVKFNLVKQMMPRLEFLHGVLQRQQLSLSGRGGDCHGTKLREHSKDNTAGLRQKTRILRTESSVLLSSIKVLYLKCDRTVTVTVFCFREIQSTGPPK